MIIAVRKATEVQLMVIKEKVVEKKSSTVTEARLQAIDEYKALETFEAKIADGSTSIFTIGFYLYKA
ncbi:hypothetical protein COCNU_01G018350 [Cocos nucifera]|uniref:Uncharacterized protein n=1 Tax=Cocos nucifera TaxID=13894 RepID=A0A8K0HWQ7_COCNU|nr:hypothetical protein COCNU_01G018350 [Cocos nucifera]